MISKLFLHSVKKKLFDGEVIVVRESIIDSEKNTVMPNIAYYRNPRRSFYITKPEYRTHKFKKERSKIEELDEFVVYNHELIEKLKNALGVFKPSATLDSLCKSPYVYGADISIEALIKMSYIDKYGLDDIPLTTGFLDIETSIIKNNNEIIVITVTHENKVFTAINENYMFEEDSSGNKKRFTIEDVIVENKIQMEGLKEHIGKFNFTFEYFSCNNEFGLVEWIFKKIHENKTDFIGIWNINFDIPKIIECIKRANKNPTDVMSHPDIPSEFRSMYYKIDKSKVSHFSLKWNWLSLTGYTQFIDSMGLYSQVRKTTRFEDSYTLDHILKVNLGFGKLTIPEADNHFLMQSKYFKKYIVYNQIDAIGIQVLEWKNEDILSMMIYANETPVSMFGYKTITTTNRFYHRLKKKGYIISSKSGEDPLRLIG